ncbi:MAG TPA: hypothetical protein VMZ91_16520 [Candidatus Paceibacterota bacterium]|nr:hypothetical protein [Candidatus Paceibacterota bacterium]
MDISEVLESPGFWILGGGGTIAVVAGYILSKKMTEFSFPIWQLGIIIIGVLAAAAFFALRE